MHEDGVTSSHSGDSGDYKIYSPLDGGSAINLPQTVSGPQQPVSSVVE